VLAIFHVCYWDFAVTMLFRRHFLNTVESTKAPPPNGVELVAELASCLPRGVCTCDPDFFSIHLKPVALDGDALRQSKARRETDEQQNERKRFHRFGTHRHYPERSGSISNAPYDISNDAQIGAKRAQD